MTVTFLTEPVRIHGFSGYAAGCHYGVCESAGTVLTSPPVPPPPTPVRVVADELILRCWVTYHHALPPALAYWAVLTQFGWTLCAKRGGKTVTVGRVYGTDAWARDVTGARLRLLGMRWSAK